jgi:hypothetical protein
VNHCYKEDVKLNISYRYGIISSLMLLEFYSLDSTRVKALCKQSGECFFQTHDTVNSKMNFYFNLCAYVDFNERGCVVTPIPKSTFSEQLVDYEFGQINWRDICKM